MSGFCLYGAQVLPPTCIESCCAVLPTLVNPAGMAYYQPCVVPLHAYPQLYCIVTAVVKPLAQTCPAAWLQVLNRPAQQEAHHAFSGMGGMENGMVDLHMATEAFRDAFSACAPPLEGPSDQAQDYLLNEAYKSPANPATGAACLIEHTQHCCIFVGGLAWFSSGHPLSLQEACCQWRCPPMLCGFWWCVSMAHCRNVRS